MFPVPKLSTHRLYNKPRVFITTESLNVIDVNVTVAGLGFETSASVSRHQYASIALPESVHLTSTGKQNKTVRVISSGAVSVHCVDSVVAEGDWFLALPTNQLGKQYHVVTYQPYKASYPAFVCISSLDKKTSVVIRNEMGPIQQVILNPYESYRFDGSRYEDLTGTVVESTQPVSVLSGVYTKVPSEMYHPDGLLEQVTPTESWGHRFVIGPFLGRSSGFIYRVLAGNTNSTLQISNRGTVQIQAGDWFEDDVSCNTVVSVVSENPVLVVQYMKSYKAEGRYDSAMIIVPSIGSFVNNVTFPVVKPTLSPSVLYYIHVTINCTFLNDLKFDDVTSMSTWEKLQSSDGEMCVIRGDVTTGVHSVTHQDSAAKFTVAVYCLFFNAFAYAYPAGFQPYSRKILIFIY